MTASRNNPDARPDAAGAVPSADDDADAVARRITGYTPRSVPANQWTDEVAGLVRRLVAAAEPATAGRAANLLTLASRFVCWATFDRGVDLAVDTMFTVELVDEWLAGQDVTAGWEKVARSELLSLNPTLNLRPPCDTVEAVLEHYTPQKVDRATWTRIRGVVVDAVEVSGPATPGAARRDLTFVSAYVAWCTAQPGMPLKPAAVWSSDTIERYVARKVVADGARASSSAGTVRAVLRRIGSAVPGNAVTRPPARYTRPGRTAPYTPGQVARLRQAATAEATPRRRATFVGLLALTLGAGLGSQDAAWPCGTGVRRHSDGTVTVTFDGPRGRTVVVADSWAVLLLDAAAAVGGGPLVGGEAPGSRNVANELIGRLDLDPTLQPLTVTRLRDTWLAGQLAAGTSVPLLLDQAGLRSMSALDPLVAHLDVPRPAEARAQLRAGRPAATDTTEVRLVAAATDTDGRGVA